MKSNYKSGDKIKYRSSEELGLGIVHKVYVNSLVVKYEKCTVRYTEIKMPEFLEDLIIIP